MVDTDPLEYAIESGPISAIGESGSLFATSRLRARWQSGQFCTPTEDSLVEKFWRLVGMH